MTVTFAPSSYDFGDVAIGSTAMVSITATNDAASAVPLTAPSGGGFSMSPASASVPANGSVTVMITFAPGSTIGYSDVLAAGTDKCSIAGVGVTLTNTGSLKSLYIAVPDYGDSDFQRLNQTQENVKMTSFLRLGNFDYSTETDKSKELLNVMHLAGSPGDPRRQNIFGGPDSLKVGEWDGTDFPNMAPPFRKRGTSDLANYDSQTPSSAEFSAELAGNRDVFFLDDVRRRDVDVDPTLLANAKPDDLANDDVQGNGLTKDQRQRESAQLYTRGGWRDHSDGNRITTTYGDKIEVIRGNYKMIVMGRQDNPGDAQGWEVSGSHITDYAPGTMPGASYWLEWVPDYLGNSTSNAGVWLLANTTENVYQFSRNAGHFRTETWGSLNETYIGSETPPPDGATVATETGHGSGGHEPPARLPGIQYDTPLRKAAFDGVYDPLANPADALDPRARPAWEDDSTGMVRSNPHVISKTWAQRIDTWNGSELCPVPFISEVTWAADTESETHFSGTATEKTYGGVAKSYTDVTGIEEETKAGYTMSVTEIGAVNEATTVGTSTAVTVAGGQNELTIAGTQNEFTVAGVQMGANLAALHMEADLTGIHMELSANLLHAEIHGALLEVSMSAALLKAEYTPTLWQVMRKKSQSSLKSSTLCLRADIGIAEEDP
jgi:hypothetical protein